MNVQIATSTTIQIFREPERRYDERISKLEARLMKLAAHRAQKKLRDREVRIEVYVPHLSAANNWLPIVEERIRASTLPDEYEDERSSEWLTEGAALAAIAFFRATADLLPAEPHIYATKEGDLVAEFETKTGSLTSIISGKETIVFAVLSDRPHEPIEKIIHMEGSKFRHELRSITNRL